MNLASPPWPVPLRALPVGDQSRGLFATFRNILPGWLALALASLTMTSSEAAPVGEPAEMSAALMLQCVETSATKPTSRNRKVIHATCALHRGPVGFANVVVSKRDGTIELDPHVTGSCVLTLAEDAAIALRDALTQWLG